MPLILLLQLSFAITVFAFHDAIPLPYQWRAATFAGRGHGIARSTRPCAPRCFLTYVERILDGIHDFGDARQELRQGTRVVLLSSHVILAFLIEEEHVCAVQYCCCRFAERSFLLICPCTSRKYCCCSGVSVVSSMSSILDIVSVYCAIICV